MDKNLLKLKKIAALMDEDRMTNEQFKTAFLKVIEFLKKNDAENKGILAELKTLLDKRLNEVSDGNASDRKVFSDALSKLETQYNKDVLSIEKLAKLQARSLQSLIPEAYDDSEIRSLINEVRSSIPTIPKIEKFDPSEIHERIDALEKKIEEKFKGMLTQMGKLQGALQTPAVTHWPRHESFTMNGSDTSVTLTQAVGAAGTAIFGIRYNGQVLDLGNQYTVNGNKITFDFTPANNSTISVSYFG